MLKAPVHLKCGITKDVNTVFYCSGNETYEVVQMMIKSRGGITFLKSRLFGISRYKDILKISFSALLLSYFSASCCMIDSFIVRLTEASPFPPPSFPFVL